MILFQNLTHSFADESCNGESISAELTCKVIEMIRTLPEVLDYADHIRYLEQKVGWLKQGKVREQKRDFQEEYD